MSVDSALAPYLCIGPLLLFVLIILLGMLFSGRLGRPPEGYSPEEQQALVRQGNALGLPVIVLFVLGGLCIGLKWLFQTINVSSADWMVSFVSLFFVVAIMGAVIYVAISSMKNGISIMRGRGQREYPQGGNAVWAGISFLIIGLVAIFVWWMAVTGQR
jgi:hypothetical protein